MSINSTLKAALEPIAPVEADTYQGSKGTYITIGYNSVAADYGDDEPDHEVFLVSVHLFAPTGRILSQSGGPSKRALAAAGMTWPSYTNSSDKDGQHHVFECETAQAAGVE